MRERVAPVHRRNGLLRRVLVANVPCAMSRALVVVPACLVALALVVGGAACSSTLNLGSESDGGGAGAAVDSAAPTCGSACERIFALIELAENPLGCVDGANPSSIPRIDTIMKSWGLPTKASAFSFA